jgi:hypothetical protein
VASIVGPPIGLSAIEPAAAPMTIDPPATRGSAQTLRTSGTPQRLCVITDVQELS